LRFDIPSTMFFYDTSTYTVYRGSTRGLSVSKKTTDNIGIDKNLWSRMVKIGGENVSSVLVRVHCI
jgi:hypothetical protein